MSKEEMDLIAKKSELNRSLATGKLYPGTLELADDVVRLERIVAKQKMLEYAENRDLGTLWKGTKSSTPLVLVSDFNCSLMYYSKNSLVTLTFCMVAGTRVLDISNETIYGHHLFGFGLDAVGSFTIVNSSWKHELMKVDSYHAQYDKERWSDFTHYMLCFHDRMFECVAKDVLSTQNENVDICENAKNLIEHDVKSRRPVQKL